jgi:hypothetical protein
MCLDILTPCHIPWHFDPQNIAPLDPWPVGTQHDSLISDVLKEPAAAARQQVVVGVQLQHRRKVVLLAQPAARAVAAPLVRQEALLGCERSTPSQLRGRLRMPKCFTSRTGCQR